MNKIEIVIPKGQLIDCTKTEVGRVLIFSFPKDSIFKRYNVIFSERLYSLEETETDWVIGSNRNTRMGLYNMTTGVMGNGPEIELLTNIKKEIERKC